MLAAAGYLPPGRLFVNPHWAISSPVFGLASALGGATAAIWVCAVFRASSRVRDGDGALVFLSAWGWAGGSAGGAARARPHTGGAMGGRGLGGGCFFDDWGWTAGGLAGKWIRAAAPPQNSPVAVITRRHNR